MTGIQERTRDRAETIRRMARRGMTRTQIAEALDVHYLTVCRYADRFLIAIHDERSDQSISKRDVSHVEVKVTLRETALLNRGKASAGEIAKAFGCTKNMVIGHWNRARQAGELRA